MVRLNKISDAPLRFQPSKRKIENVSSIEHFQLHFPFKNNLKPIFKILERTPPLFFIKLAHNFQPSAQLMHNVIHNVKPRHTWQQQKNMHNSNEISILS